MATSISPLEVRTLESGASIPFGMKGSEAELAAKQLSLGLDPVMPRAGAPLASDLIMEERGQ